MKIERKVIVKFVENYEKDKNYIISKTFMDFIKEAEKIRKKGVIK